MIFLLHILPWNNSMINLKTTTYNLDNSILSTDYLAFVVDVHENQQLSFKKRPLTTWGISYFSSFTGLSLALSFVIIQFVLLFLNGVALGALSVQLGLKSSGILKNLLFFYLSFTIVFMFFEPVFSYDEPLQYLLIFLSLGFYLKKKYLIFVLVFVLACIARESSLFLLPGLYFIQNQSYKIELFKNWKAALSLVSITIFYFFVW